MSIEFGFLVLKENPPIPTSPLYMAKKKFTNGSTDS